jgi:hypothetical protein
MKPAVPGMPASEIMKSVMSAASAGLDFARPAKDCTRSQSCPWWASATTTAKAPRFMKR